MADEAVSSDDVVSCTMPDVTSTSLVTTVISSDVVVRDVVNVSSEDCVVRSSKRRD